jgi:hypothetical protein
MVIIIDYNHQYNEYTIYEKDGNVRTTDDEDEAIAIAKSIYGNEVEVKINEQ